MSDSSPHNHDLADLLPGRDVSCKGETIRVVPLYFGQYPTAIKLVRPLAQALGRSGLFEMKDEGGKVKFAVSGNWITAVPVLFEEGGEALIQFFAFAISKPRTWFDTLPGDQGIELAQAIFEENKDFFVRRILPILEKSGLMKALGAEGGDPSSQDSTATDTAGPTSN